MGMGKTTTWCLIQFGVWKLKFHCIWLLIIIYYWLTILLTKLWNQEFNSHNCIWASYNTATPYHVNWMAAGSRLSWCIMDFFSCLQLFKHTVLTYHLQQAVGPGVLQTFSTCAVKP